MNSPVRVKVKVAVFGPTSEPLESVAATVTLGKSLLMMVAVALDGVATV